MPEQYDLKLLATLRTHDLLDAHNNASLMAAHYAKRKAAVVLELGRRYGAGVKTQLILDGKEHGTTRFLMPGVPHAALKGEIKRTVKWDSEKLLAMAFAMPRGEALGIFKIDVSVPERAFAEATGNFRAALEDARTTTLGALTITPMTTELDS